MLLEEVELWVFVEYKVTITVGHAQLVDYKKKEAKAKRIILDSMKNYLIPPIVEKKMAKEMYDALIVLY